MLILDIKNDKYRLYNYQRIQIKAKSYFIIECHCEKCEHYAGNVEYLEQQLSDAHIMQETLKQKLSKTKTTLATTIERESRLR